MKYDLTLSNSDRSSPCVVVRVYKPATKALMLRLLEEAAQMAREHTVDRFLIDVSRVPGERSPLCDYELAYDHLGQLGVMQQSRAALLVSKDDKSHSFLETVARNAGYSWRLFREERDAVDWLEERNAFQGSGPVAFARAAM